MKKLAFIFTVDCNRQADEKRFDYMSLLLLDSIKRFNPEAEIYCGVFSNRIPSCKPELLDRMSDPKFHYIEDIKFYIGKHNNAGYLRNYCCNYFSEIIDLTEEFETVVYLDIDVILTAPFDPEIHKPDNGVVFYEEFDDVIRFYECNNTTRFLPDSGKMEWYHNWIQIINKSNKHAFRDRSEEFGIHMKFFYSDLMFSMLLKQYHDQGLITLKHQNVGTIPFYSHYKKSHFCIHYDNFERRGTFVCTKNILSKIDYTKFLIRGEYYLKQKCANDPNLQYWRNAVEQYKKYKPERLPDFIEYEDDLIW